MSRSTSFLLACAATGVVSAADVDTQLDTVTITATRLGLGLEEVAGSGALGSRSLLDTPYSVTVVDQDDIARRQVTTIGQIFINDPSVFAAEPSASTNWWGTQIRGLGVQNHYVDGVPVLMEWGGEFPLESVERVTALKGLGGFMFGFGSPGGVISYETKQPANTPLLTTNLGYRNNGAVSAHVDAGGRIAGPGSLGYRLNVAGEQGDAYNGAGIHRALVALAVDQPIGEDLTWYAEAFHEDSKLKHEPLYFYWDLYEGEQLPRPTYDYEDVSVANSFYRSETLHGSTGLKWRIDDAWRANFSVGYSRREHYSNKMFADLLNEAGDYDGSVYNFAGILRNIVTQALVQGELGSGALKHELVLGATYQKSWEQWGNDWYWSRDFSGNLYEPQTYRTTREIDFSMAPVSYDERQGALFASDTLHVGEHWQAILGARYTRYLQRDLDGDPEVDSRYEIDVVTPTVALIFKPVEQVSLYGSYVESLEPGSRVGELYANAGELLEATRSRQYEIGAKYEVARLGFTAAAFRVERAAQIEQLRGGERYLTQDGLTLYNGLEAIGSLGITPHLRVGLGATLLDASLEDVSADNAGLEGKRPAGSSRWQAVANVEYQVPQLPGLSFHGNARHFGDAYYQDLNVLRIPDRTIVSMGAQHRMRMGDRVVSLTGNINNLLNEKYWNLNTLGEGINASLSIRVEW